MAKRALRSAPPASARAADPFGTGTVHRTVRMLAAVVDAAEPVSVKRLSEDFGLPTSTVHRLLQLLCKEGMLAVDTDTHLYGIGPELYRLSARVTATVRWPEIVAPLLGKLSERFNETVLFCLYLPVHGALSFVARADGTQALQYRIEMNSRFSLIWGASGLAVAAFLPEPVIESVLAAEGPSPASGRPLPSRETLKRKFALIRNQGYAVSEGEKLPGARGIAAPVFGHDRVLGSICLTSPKERLLNADLDTIGRVVARHAAELSRTLGASPSAPVSLVEA